MQPIRPKRFGIFTTEIDGKCKHTRMRGLRDRCLLGGSKLWSYFASKVHQHVRCLTFDAILLRSGDIHDLIGKCLQSR